MPISITCSCGKRYSAPDSAAGKQTKCKACGAVIRIPGPGRPRPAAARPKPELDFADERPGRANPEDLYQGPSPQAEDPAPADRSNPAAILYGQGPSERASTKKSPQATYYPWLVILVLTLLAAGAFKLFLLDA